MYILRLADKDAIGIHVERPAKALHLGREAGRRRLGQGGRTPCNETERERDEKGKSFHEGRSRIFEGVSVGAVPKAAFHDSHAQLWGFGGPPPTSIRRRYFSTSSLPLASGEWGQGTSPSNPLRACVAAHGLHGQHPHAASPLQPCSLQPASPKARSTEKRQTGVAD